MHLLPTRQVHLDFHTSEKIPGVGAEFDPKLFADTIEAAAVNSVTVFARCHHGYLYYPSRRFPELVHPTLGSRDLLMEEIRALHERGIKAPVYITVQWDYHTATRHPEWLIRKPDGRHEGGSFSEPGFYQSLCINTGYLDYLNDITDDVMEHVGEELDGLFFDIVGVRDCTCAACRKKMSDAGIDYGDPAAVTAFAKESIDRFRLAMTERVQKRAPGCSVYYNAGHAGPVTRESNAAFSHHELESLPSGGWGYLHFPTTVRYARTLGKDVLGMTGKFHTAWGDFHSLKNQAALEYECFQALSFGCGCSIGDQLEPSGRINPHTYELIGAVYRQVAEREAWARPSTPVVEAALVTPEGMDGVIPDCVRGAVQLLGELGLQFDIIDPLSDPSSYSLLILPEGLSCDKAYAKCLNEYVNRGGKLLAMADGGLCNGSYPTSFGADYQGEHDACDFVIPNSVIGKGYHEGNEFVMYLPSVSLQPHTDSEVLMEASSPYFYRHGTDFCSHSYTPSSKSGLRPAAVRHGNVILFAHRLFSEYQRRAPQWCKLMVRDALELLLGEKRLVRHNGPSTLRVSLLHQPEHRRYTLHLLSYIPVRKCAEFDIIEDRTPAPDVDVTLRLPIEPRSARLVPEDLPLPLTNQTLHLDRINGYAIVELAY